MLCVNKYAQKYIEEDEIRLNEADFYIQCFLLKLKKYLLSVKKSEKSLWIYMQAIVKTGIITNNILAVYGIFNKVHR